MSIVVSKTRLPVTQWQTASGSVVSISDARKRYAKSLSVALEPKQDLHGYSAPWVGGAGKNLAPFEDVLPDGFTKTERGITVTVHNGIVHLEGVSESQTTWNILDYQTVWNINGISNYPISAGTYSIANGLTCRISSNNKSGTFSITETAYIRGFYIFVSGNKYQQQVNQDIPLAIVAGSTIPTEWTPYENLCPISGRSSVTAYDDPKYGGKIWWNQLLQEKNFVASYSKFGLLFTKVSGKTAFDISGTFSYSSGDRNAYIFTLVYNVPIVADHVYYASSNSAYANVYMYGATFTNNYNNNVPHGGSIVKASNSANLNMSLHFGSNIKKNTEINETVYLNLFDLTEMFGESVANDVYAMDYENKGSGVAWFRNLFPSYDYEYNAGTETLVSAVNGDPYISVTLSLGQTVYGGSVNLVSGVMTVTHGIIDLGDFNYNPSTYAGVFGGLAVVTPLPKPVASFSTVANAVCSALGVVSDATFNSDGVKGEVAINTFGYLKVKGVNATTKEELKAEMTGIMLCYELATPQTIQLSPNQIEMLMRNNTVWSDAGVVTLEYARIRQ